MLSVWCDEALDPREQMRRDAAMLSAAERGAPPLLRLFRFRPFGITLGHAQKPESSLDLERCERDGVPWAVRPTGGRAIFHAEEWTYAFACALGDPEWGGDLHGAYAKVSRLVLESLRALGVPAGFAPGQRPGHEAPSERTAACFASAAKHELVIEARKFVGSAQRRTARAYLQEGSVLLGPGHLRLADYLAIPSSRREAVRGALARDATDAGRWIAPDAPLERWALALLDALGARGRRVDGDAGAMRLTL
jgi:lipoate-protein ligase A